MKPPFLWIENAIGPGFKVDITETFYLKQRLGLGVHFIFSEDKKLPGPERTQLILQGKTALQRLSATPPQHRLKILRLIRHQCGLPSARPYAVGNHRRMLFGHGFTGIECGKAIATAVAI